MKFRTPEYYSQFRCSSDKCKDNCCIGWEICIDSNTSEYYAHVEGEFGKRLRENISDEKSFILKAERCPFLNSRNLCDIIINCGEDSLCQICSDHPRFFEWYSDLKEGGIGLSCEQAARLILTGNGLSFEETDTDEEEEPVDEELFNYLFSCRESIFRILADSTVPLTEKLCEILDCAEKVQYIADNREPKIEEAFLPFYEKEESSIGELLSLFDAFEPIDDIWTGELKLLQESCCGKKVSFDGKDEEYITNLLIYFIYRYFLKGTFDEEILSKVKFAVVSAIVIKTMVGEDSSFENYTEKSKLYSKQMEYSDENRELFSEFCYEKACLSTGRIKGLLG